VLIVTVFHDNHGFMIQLHRLEGFYRVAVAAGYARAARSFPYPITQPAVHQQVRKLEEDLGVRLFERTGKDRVVPTAAGRTLLQFCAPFFEELPAVVRAVSSGKHGGVLRVDAAAMELEHVLPPWIARLRRARPDIRVDIEEVAAGDPARLLRGEADLVVDYQPALPPGVEGRQVATYYAFVAAPLGLGGRAAPSLARLRSAPFVGFHPSLPQHALQMQALEHAGSVPEHTLSASSTNALLALVRAGLGYTIVPWPSLRGPRVRGVAIARLKGAHLRFAIVASWRRRAAPDPLVQAALDALP
jgi:DNA-binding transcriptional LysR family regulator